MQVRCHCGTSYHLDDKSQRPYYCTDCGNRLRGIRTEPPMPSLDWVSGRLSIFSSETLLNEVLKRMKEESS